MTTSLAPRPSRWLTPTALVCVITTATGTLLPPLVGCYLDHHPSMGHAEGGLNGLFTLLGLLLGGILGPLALVLTLIGAAICHALTRGKQPLPGPV
ncbi:hypothetical protein LY474_36630 [Myxococcus stipitatus]|uniref:hypothetical protein n=1 Tax=Myxococcus stipitatus TaxID=83455 RepID=UPI001F1EC593|nr:hypothetical protein [Myxococcus stipitatus]MCE9673350.1 hypothetical protein [Myxococcus stipitatus]